MEKKMSYIQKTAEEMKERSKQGLIEMAFQKVLEE
jgi:hypothetical protein